MAAPGTITRMPRVCMSMVASAFQYGCAPTFTPVTTRLISPPACVNVTIRRSTRAIQSMFSVPLSIEIRAPADTANQSTGTPSASARSMAAAIRRHSGSASAPMARLGSPSSTTRCMPSGCRAVKVRTTPTTTFARFSPGGRVTGTSAPPASRSCSWNSPGGTPTAEFLGGASIRTSS